MLSVIASAYDGSLHGWQGSVEELKLVFAFKAHESCIRVLDAKDDIACSAASDESIQVYDLGRRKVIDRMSGVHDEEVTALAFAKDKDGDIFLISGDAKGRLYVWEMQERKVIHELKGHKQSSAVTSIAVHPSGRVALSTAKDNSLRMWDLVNAKPAPRIKLDDFSTLSCTCWSPDDGARYALVGDEMTLAVFDALSPSEKPTGLCKHPRRINSVRFAQDVVLITACDDGILRVVGADGSLVRKFEQSNGRIRLRDVAFVALAPHDTNEEDEDPSSQSVIVGGAYSDGCIRLWNLDDDQDEPFANLNVGTGAHLTSMCLTWIPQTQSDQSKPKKEVIKAPPPTKRARKNKTGDAKS